MQSACYEAQHVLAAAYLAQDPLVGGSCWLCIAAACKRRKPETSCIASTVFTSAPVVLKTTQHTQSDDALDALEGEAALAGAALPGSDLHTLTASRLVGLLRQRHGSKHARTQAAVAAAVEVRLCDFAS